MEREKKQIKTERLLLRDIITSDVYKVYQGLSHPQVIQYYGVSYDSLEATNEQMEWFAASQQSWWAICSLDGQTFYGAAGLNDISMEHKKAEIGLWLLPEFWGKGIMTEVIPLICQYGFDVLRLHRIEGFVDASNSNCKKAMAKIDFDYEGTMRDCEIKNGTFVSVDIYAKIHR